METRKVLDDFSNSIKQVDRGLILRLLKNPLESMHLTEKEFLYGILGAASAIIGFAVWALLMVRKITSMFYGWLFGGFAGLFGEIPASDIASMFGKLLMLGFLSTASLLAAVWLIGWWRSGSQPPIKSFVARVGSLHYIGGAGFILAGLASFSMQLSFTLLIITLLSLLALTLYAGSEASGIAKERLASYFILSVSAYVLLVAVATNLIL